MREIPIFIASSVREFRQGRLELSPFLEMLNKVYKRMDAQLVWNRPETSPRVMNDGGSQLVFDDFIRKSEFFALIVGKSVGTYTRHEYEIALEQFRKTGKPKILPCFLADTSPEAQAFRAELQNAPIGVQFIDPYDNFDAVKSQLQFEIANYVVETAPQSDAETDFQRARERIRDKIRGLRAEIKRLKAAPTSPETIAEITLNYAEIWRLVREYKVEPDALLGYMWFLCQQHQYSTGIEIGHWLEGFYKIENLGEKKQAMLKNRLCACYLATKQYQQAERYCREELEINRRLAAKSPIYEKAMAITYNNLAGILRATLRKEEAEVYYWEALEIWRREAKDNPAAFEPYVASIYVNLGELFYITKRMEEAETYYRKTLEIRRRLAEANPDVYLPDVAATCNNLGVLLYTINRIEEAEAHYREALEIWQRLAKSNPGSFEPYLAVICYNLGCLELNIPDISMQQGFLGWIKYAFKVASSLLKITPDERDVARQYFEEALSLFKKFPHLTQEALICRIMIFILTTFGKQHKLRHS